jgi:hypothetical protein
MYVPLYVGSAGNLAVIAGLSGPLSDTQKLAAFAAVSFVL